MTHFDVEPPSDQSNEKVDRPAKRVVALRRLRALEAFLKRYQVSYTSVVSGVIAIVEADKCPTLSFESWRAVRGMFGGMGSLTDVAIDRRNGDVVDDARAANRELDALTNAVWRDVVEETDDESISE